MVLTNISKMCKIYNTFTSVAPFLPDATMLWREICMMHMQTLTSINITQAWSGRSEYLKGGNLGMSKHASKTRTEHARSWAGSWMAQRRVYQMRSLQMTGDEPFCHLASPGMLTYHR